MVYGYTTAVLGLDNLDFVASTLDWERNRQSSQGVASPQIKSETQPQIQQQHQHHQQAHLQLQNTQVGTIDENGTVHIRPDIAETPLGRALKQLIIAGRRRKRYYSTSYDD